MKNLHMRICRGKEAELWSCPYMENHERDAVFEPDQVYPDGICPWLYFSVYPYMLGLLYGADFRYNEEGDAWACCPAVDGCEMFIRKRERTPEFSDARIDPKHSFVIYAEVHKVGDCPAGHQQGDKFLFPTCMQDHFACPAAWYHAFPLSNPERPTCLQGNEIRCPDWQQPVTIMIKDKDNE